jgi:hypothetical protein
VKSKDADELIYLILRPLRDPDGIPVSICLRSAFKTLLRRDKLKRVAWCQLRPIKDETKQ